MPVKQISWEYPRRLSCHPKNSGEVCRRVRNFTIALRSHFAPSFDYFRISVFWQISQEQLSLSVFATSILVSIYLQATGCTMMKTVRIIVRTYDTPVQRRETTLSHTTHYLNINFRPNNWCRRFRSKFSRFSEHTDKLRNSCERRQIWHRLRSYFSSPSCPLCWQLSHFVATNIYDSDFVILKRVTASREILVWWASACWIIRHLTIFVNLNVITCYIAIIW